VAEALPIDPADVLEASPQDLRVSSGAGSALTGLLISLRPKQWLKNVLVLAAPWAAGTLFHRTVLARSGLAVACFCLVASATYLVNDVVDVEQDRAHPWKRFRPVADGVVSARQALVAAVVLAAVGLGGSTLLGADFLALTGLYLGITLAYTLRLKWVAVLDIAAVASGFVIRAVAGGIAVHVPTSQWFLILTSFGSLFVVAGKRFGDALPAVRRDGMEAVLPRGYTIGYLRYVWMLASAVAIAAYCLWAFAVPHVHLEVAWSELSVAPFVLAVLRYGLLLEWGRGASPEDVLLSDPALIALGAVWVLVYGAGVYLGH
jgi:decaprenyl-phosphate phosphoribosyltransferase